MGRYYWDSKSTVEDSTQLSIFKLKEFGLLSGFRADTLTWTWRLSGRKSSIGIVVDTEDLYAKVNYTITDRNTGEKTDCDYKIPLVTTPCHFGGVRYWFICPLSKSLWGWPSAKELGRWKWRSPIPLVVLHKPPCVRSGKPVTVVVPYHCFW